MGKICVYLKLNFNITQICANMFDRTLEKALLHLSTQYPVVTITGMRQSGKTTLARHSFPNKSYANLEFPETRELAEVDPKRFLAQFPKGAILDEIQRAPHLLSYIQVIVDELQENGLFILTGSHQLSLHEAVAQSLAGRTALLTLYPMTLRELDKAGFELSLDKQLLNGCFPRIYKEHLDPSSAYRNYFHTYVERDVRQLINVKDISQFQRFIKLCAGRIGGILDLSSLANDVGVSVHTINHWLSILEASYIIFRLPPYFENFGKRIIKSPKLYFTDVGLAIYLLDIENVSQLKRDPLRGNLFENFVILELMKYRLNRGKDPNLYYYRDSHKNEVDIIIKSGNELIPVEIKSSETFSTTFLKTLKLFKNIAGDRVRKGYVIYAGSQEQGIGDFALLNYRNLSALWDQSSESN